MEKLQKCRHLQIRRHTDKNGEQASQAGLDRFQTEDNLVTDPNSITSVFCGSLLGRTAQTALAACCAHGIRARVHEADPRFGSLEMFNGLKARGLLEKAKEVRDNLLSALLSILTPDELAKLKDDLKAATEKAFEEIEEGGHGLLFHHSPLVELTAAIFGNPEVETLKLQSCEGIMLERDYDGVHITVIAIYHASA